MPDRRPGIDPNIESSFQRVFIVYNPVAGPTRLDATRETIERFCKTQNWDFFLHETSPADDLRHIIHKALKENFDLIIAAGGDGTVSGVVSGLVSSQRPLAILPTGTGNVLARVMGIPLNLENALTLLLGPYRIQALDVMEINEKNYSVLNVSVGISSKIMRNTPREEKRRFGMLAYIWRGIESLSTSDLYRVSLQIDGRKFRVQASEIMIANTSLMGLQPQIDGVTVDARDGRLDLFIVRARNARDYLDVFIRFLIRLGRDTENKLTYLPIHEYLAIETRQPLPVQADGEAIGFTPVRLRLVASGLNLITPL